MRPTTLKTAGVLLGGALCISMAATAHAGAVGPINTGAYTGPVEIQYNGFTTEAGVTASTNETTWGAGFITNIFEFGNSSNIFYSNAIPGVQRIGYVLYGIADANIRGPVGGPFQIFNTGCTGGPCDGKIHIDFYALPNATGTNFGVADPAGLTVADRALAGGWDQFDGITNVVGGSLLMKWELVAGIQTVDVAGGTDPLFDETLATLIQNVSSTTLPATGDGDFLADCISGPACALFDTNGQTAGSDFFGQFSLSASLTSQNLINGWEGRTSDPVETAVIPEPISAGLFGFGILGLGLLRRRLAA